MYVAVHVMFPSPVATVVNAPFGTVRSVLSNPLTISENVIVTRLVSPTAKAESASTTPSTVGLFVSIV